MAGNVRLNGSLVFLIVVDSVFCLFSTENAAEKELWRENSIYKDPGELINKTSLY